MADPPQIRATPSPPAPPVVGRLWAKVARRIFLGLGALAMLLGLIAAGLDTGPGRGLLVAGLDGLSLGSGLSLHIRRIEGSIYGRMTLRDVDIRDPAGVFVTAPEVTLDWRPQALFSREVEINALSSPLIDLKRAPRLKLEPPRRPDRGPFNLHLAIGSLRVARLVLEPALTGDRRTLTVEGHGAFLKRQLQVWARAQEVGDGGDHLEVRLDAAPDADKLALAATIYGPTGGVLDRLLGLNGAISLKAGGAGGWQTWTGQVRGDLDGRSILESRLSARDGDFQAAGRLFPARLGRPGPLAALTADGVDFNLMARLKADRMSVDARARTAGVAATVLGGVDLGRGRLDTLKVNALMAGAHPLPGGVSGRDLSVQAVLNGPWDRPDVTFDFKAADLGQGALRVTTLRAAGQSRQGPRQSLGLDFKATADQISGLPAAAESLATHVALQGDLTFRAGRLVAGGAKLHTDRLSADFILDPAAKGLAGTLKAQAAGYRWAGLGAADISLDARVARDDAGRLSLAGETRVRSRHVEDPALQAILGGDADLEAYLTYGPNGALGLQAVTLVSPGLEIASGHGALGAHGDLALSLTGRARDHGPLSLALSGTLDAPRARLRASEPGFAGLSGLEIEAKALGGHHWSVDATARADQQPVTLAATLDVAPDGLVLEVQRASFESAVLSGTLKQTPGGTFAGDLRLVGPGLAGAARLGARGKAQTVALNLTAKDAHLPTSPAVTIARGDAHLDLTLGAGEPTLTGAINLIGIKRQGVSVARARLDVTLRDGLGDVRISASGSKAAPFTLNAAANVSPGLVRITGEGTVDKVPLRLEAPAQLHLSGADYRLDPVTLVLPHGRLILAGTQGPHGLKGQLDLKSVDLAISRLLAPDLDFGGLATGVASLDAPANGAMPTAHVQLQVTGFTRTAAAVVSQPVDISVLGDLSPIEAQAHAVVRRGGAVVGRLQLALTPEGDDHARSWVDRLADAPVRGGVRFEGPAEILWGLAGVGGRTLSGPVAIGVDVGGRLKNPQLSGILRSAGLRFADPTLGAVIDHIAIDGRFSGSRLELTSLTARAGSGSLSASGFADLAESAGFPLDLKISLSRARLANTANAAATVSGALDVTHDRAKGARIAGDLTLDQASYDIAQASSEDVVELTGVRWVDAAAPSASGAPEDILTAASRPSAWKLDINVSGGSHVFVNGLGLEAEWRTAFHVGGDAKDPVVVGDVNLVRGSFEFAGRKLSLTRGVIHLAGATPPDPILDIQATTTVAGVTAEVNISGTANHPQISFTSSPALPQDQVLARLLFGGSATTISPLQAVQLAASINALRGSGADPLVRLQRAVKLDRLSVYAADPTLGRGASVGAGKYINSRVYVEVATDAKGYAATQVEIALTKAFRLLSQVGTELGGTSINLQYTKQY
jgi:translocation and assembly module TamB